MTTVLAASTQSLPMTPPHHHRQPQPQSFNRPSLHSTPSRIQFTSPPSSFSPLAPTPFSPFRTSALYRTTSLLSPTSSASVHSAARALTQLRSPNRFEAPLDDDDEEEDGYREHVTAGGSDEDEDDADEKYADDDDERVSDDGQQDGLVDLSALLLQLRVDKRNAASPQRQRRPTPPHQLALAARTNVLLSPSSSLPSSSSPHSSSSLVVPSPLESSIALTLQDMQLQYVERAEQAIDARISALQSALQLALKPTLHSSSASPLSPLSSLASLHTSTRPSIQSLANQWQSYHSALQQGYKQSLDELVAAEEKQRQAREDQESKLRQEKAEAEAEAARRQKAAEEENERKDREAKEQEDRRQKEEHDKNQQESEQKQRDGQQQAQQAAQAATTPATIAPQPSTISPAQAELQSHQSQLAEIRALAATYTSPDKTKHKVLINRTITQISHTKPSVTSKSLALNTLLTSAKRAANPAEYAWVVESVAAKLVGQGETRVALQLTSAYSFGAVVLHVCRNDAVLWSCFYAMLCEKCVFAVPTYLDRKRYPTQIAHMTAMGWQQTTNDKGEATWEEESVYFSRLEGYIALYAAVCQYITPHSATSHIHSLPQAWLWLSRICNHEPRAATASVLYAFLSIAAFSMYRKYGQQMGKVLMYVRQEVLGRLERSSGEKTPARKAAMARLQLWLNAELEVLRRTGQLSEPEGRKLPEGQSQSTETLHVSDHDYRGE